MPVIDEMLLFAFSTFGQSGLFKVKNRKALVVPAITQGIWT